MKMKQHQLDRRRMALFSAVLVIGGSAALLVGSTALGSHLSRARATAPAMAGMPAAPPTSAAAAAATVVWLHQHVVNVSIMNFAFGPAWLVVSPGTRIIWTNQDSDPHTVTSTTAIWASEAQDTGSQFARVFTTAGTFPYYCAIHPFMHGMIVVKS
jgi:plastocyanin